MSDGDRTGPGYAITANRVATWRRGHKNYPVSVATYAVFHDGTQVTSFPASQSSEGLNEDLASAVYDVAQGLDRAVTVDLVAYDAQGGELARKPLRVQPERAPAAEVSNIGEVVKVLLDAQKQQGQQTAALLTACVSMVREVAGIATNLAQATAERVREAETDNRALRALVTEAVDTAHEAEKSGADAMKMRREEFILAFLAKKLDMPFDVLMNGSNGKAD